MSDAPHSAQALRTALNELRTNQEHFTPESFALLLSLIEGQLAQSPAETDTEDMGLADEIRLVTVMFIDVVDSTRMAQQLDTSDWKTIIGNAHARLSGLILEWDGHVGQYLGDGLLCFFGAQHSRGDDALRAVACALEAIKRMQYYAEEIKGKHNIDFRVRIGISTGRVVVGMVGIAEKQELLALGPATNLAARLQTLATPDGIVIDSETYSRVRTRYHTTPQPPISLKGFKDDIDTYSLDGVRTQRRTQFANPSVAGLDIPFIGRVHERQAILNIWEEAVLNEQCQVVTITGEVGLGKSRLLQEITERISEKPLTQLTMVASYERRGTSYNLLRDLLLANCADLTEDLPLNEARRIIHNYVAELWADEGAHDVADVLGYLTGYDFADSAVVESLKSGGRFQDRLALTWLSRWFRGMAATSPLLIAVDNLQWADPLSLDMLEQAARDLHDEEAMIIAVGRSEFWSQKTDYMQAYPQHTRIHLEQLDTDDTAVLIDQIISYVERVPKTLPSLIQERAEGNPLFVQEFLGMLFDNGVFQPTGENQWKFNVIKYQDASDTLPSGLTGVLQARLDELSLAARQIVQIAAVIGQTFWLGLLTEIADEGDINPVLVDLERRGMIVRSPESAFDNEIQFQFSHTLYQEVAYGMLPRAKRERYHKLVAQWLIVRVAGKPEHFPTLAEQFKLAGEHTVALFTYLEAVQNRIQRGLLDETLSLIDDGLAHARNVPRDRAVLVVSQLWAIRSQTLNALNRFQEASAASESALTLLKEVPDNQLNNARVLAARMLGLAYRSQGRYLEALEALTRAFSFISSKDIAQQASVLRNFGSLALYRGHLDESLAYQQRALNYAQNAGQKEELSGAMTQLGLIALDKGNLSSALGYFEQVLEVNKKRDHIPYQILDLGNIGAAYHAMFAYDLALDALEKAEELQTYIQYNNTLLQAHRGITLMALGRTTEGMLLVEEAAKLGHEDAYYKQLIQLMLVEGHVRNEHYSLAQIEGQPLLDYLRDNNPIIYGRMCLWLGQALHHLGDATQATILLEEALDYELEFAGRDAWLCYMTLAQHSDNPIIKQAYQGKASNILRAVGFSLSNRPELQAVFMYSSPVQMTLETTESDV